MDIHSTDPSHDLSNISKQAEVVVIVVPFPCQSHLNQLLHLSCLISSHNIPIHYTTTATHLRQAKLRFNNTTHLQNSQLHFHEFPTPDFISPPPTPNPSTKFPTHLQPAFDSSIHLRQPMAALLHRISGTARRVIIIHDVLMAYVVQDVANVPNVESYAFNPTCPFSSYFDGWQLNGEPIVEETPPEGLPSLDGCYTTEFMNFVTLQADFLKFTTGYIYNSCRSIDGAYIDLIAKDQLNKLIWAIGPLNLGSDSDKRNSNTPKHNCLEWLDKQAPNSILYVSFGTTTTMTDEEIKELAMGLEQSEQKYIWAFRDADKGDIFAGEVKKDKLPEGFEERVKEVGIVVRDWAPQVEILGHPSTGGFMSHCGWNSCLESITMGVPIAAWPMHSDQPKNAFLVTDILKVGLPVNTWEQREKIVSSSTIAKAVKKLMATKEGEAIRKRAEELGASTRKAVEEGGVSRMELDSFIAHITRTYWVLALSSLSNMYVPPRFLSNKVRGYEKVKQQTLKENLAKMDAKGIKNLPNLSKSLFGSKQSCNTKGTDKGKNQIGRGDDDADYVPSDGEGRLGSSSEEDDSSGSRANKVRSTGLGMKKGRSGPGMKKGGSPTQLLQKSLRTQEQGHSALQTQPPAVVAECMATLAAQPSQLPTSPIEQINPFCSPNTTVGSGASSQIVSKKRGRGPTRGKNVDKLRKILGQPIPVDINPETMSIEGEHATSVAYAIGLNIRDHAPVRDIGWGDIDFGIRESIVMRVGQIFGIGDYKNDMVVRRVIDIKCQSLYSDWKCELHNHYKYLKEKKVSDLKNHALYPCNPNDWVFMIENVWESEDWKKKSLKGQKARSFLKFNHTSGSRSFASRASIYVKKNNKKQPFTDSFKETHIRHRVGNDAWINDKAKECHEEMVRLTSEQSQPNVANPLSEEQISVKVLGKRSGYLKGYGIRKNNKFLDAMPSQAIPNQEVVELKKQLDDQAKAMAAMADKAKMFEKVILMMAMKSGIDPTCIPGLVPGSGNEEDTWVGEQDDEDSD